MYKFLWRTSRGYHPLTGTPMIGIEVLPHKSHLCLELMQPPSRSLLRGGYNSTSAMNRVLILAEKKSYFFGNQSL